MPLHSGIWVDLPGQPRTDTSATAASSSNSATDGITTSSVGGAVEIWMSSFSGTSVTFTLNDSADNSTFTAVAGGFQATLAAPGRVLMLVNSNQTIRKYLAVATSGTFTTATFEAQVLRG
jgi:hypothetical protein